MFNEIDQHLEAHPLATIAKKQNKFDQLLAAILPILEKWVVPALFFKPSWQAFLRGFIFEAKKRVASVQSLENEPLSGVDTDGDGIDDWQDDDADGDGIDWLSDPNDPRHGKPE